MYQLDTRNEKINKVQSLLLSSLKLIEDELR